MVKIEVDCSDDDNDNPRTGLQWTSASISRLTCGFTIPTTAAPGFPADKGVAVVRDFDDECATVPGALEDEGDAPARDSAESCFFPRRPGMVV
jgi:hypothetical protein